MNGIIGFAPIASQSAKILILGSMPSSTSLTKQQYYGHPRNAFWPIMLALLNLPVGFDKSSYSERKQLLLQNDIAVWDVLQSCFREGSLDTAIKMDSIKLNDFYRFFKLHPTIKTVCFNGTKAETLYNKYVLADIKTSFQYIKYIKLPSTSPAYAAMSIQQKMTIWSGAVTYNKRSKKN